MGYEAKGSQLMLLACLKVKELKYFITSVINTHKFLKLNLIAKKLKIKFHLSCDDAGNKKEHSMQCALCLLRIVKIKVALIFF